MKLPSGSEAGWAFVNAAIVEASRQGRTGKKKKSLIRQRCADRINTLQDALGERLEAEETLEQQVTHTRQKLRKRLKHMNRMTRHQLLQQRERDIALCAVEAVDLPGIAVSTKGTVGALKRLPKPVEGRSPYANLTGAEVRQSGAQPSLKSIARADRVLFESHWMRLINEENERLKQEEAQRAQQQRDRNRDLTQGLEKQKGEMAQRRQQREVQKRREKEEAERDHTEWVQGERKRKADERSRCQKEQDESTALLRSEHNRRNAAAQQQREAEQVANLLRVQEMQQEQQRQREAKLDLQRSWKDQLAQRDEQRRLNKQALASPVYLLNDTPHPWGGLFQKRDKLEKLAEESFRERSAAEAKRQERQAAAIRIEEQRKDADDQRRKEAVVDRNLKQASVLNGQLQEKVRRGEMHAAKEREEQTNIDRHTEALDGLRRAEEDKKRIRHMQYVMTLDLQRSMRRANDMRGLQIKIK